MRIDLPTIRLWVEKWQARAGGNKTASQLAAVMLCRMLSETEDRLTRSTTLMRDIIAEGQAATKLQQEVLLRIRTRRGMDLGLEGEMKDHRRRMCALSKEASELMKAPKSLETMEVGGLLFEVDRGEGQEAKGVASSAR